MPDPTNPPVVQPPANPPAPPAPPVVASPPAPAPAPAPTPAPSLLTEPPKNEDVVVKFPKEVTIDDKRLAKFTTLAKEIGLKSDSAQKVADFYVETQKEMAARHMEEVAGWAKAAEADKEIGGAAFKENLLIANRAYEKVASPELRALIQESGLGNHPEVIRLFYKIGKTISEDKLPGGDGGRGGEPTIQDLLKEAYPNSPTMWGPK